ncbi:metalloregulator ArsR/SmtB family transcription factor [Roseibium porphyridii]|uniref:Metalloregulator ArsR/SmtB family transcription factor n=1 Tax=Roseibium porphyridii TaxID=2866279 RepID=A0ABY8FGC6_9HYPH|nr:MULTISPECIES: metalloregulator ArsR/SmtB family transcription factor [Stappiaceae]QFT31011.1 Helix-turn-helix domain protein [Labrenzia sp. THAF82]WFE91623.1 metalloregulator ArsR/SmtB family transcription factor [Roseibium sp. KMA01]
MNDQDAVSALGALAQDNRLAAFRLLMQQGPNGLPSGDVAMQLNIPPTRMSFHLTTLERAGLLIARRDGRHIHYSVDIEAMRALLAFLVEDCCGNDPSVCGFSSSIVSKPENAV